MLANPSRKLCRFIVAVLLFNMLIPVAYANSAVARGDTVMMCTSLGLVKVSLSTLETSLGPNSGEFLSSNFLGFNSTPSSDSVSQMQTEHCPYCLLFELVDGHQADLPPYPVPSSELELNYSGVLTSRSSSYLTKHVLLRAPPVRGQ